MVRHLYRGKRIDTGEWVIGNRVDSPDGRVAISETSGEWGLCECIPSTICQCTGLKDMNGELIWENDILEGHLDDKFPEDVTREKVIWHEMGWKTEESGCDDKTYLDEFDTENFEVVGNVFDNPELLV